MRRAVTVRNFRAAWSCTCFVVCCRTRDADKLHSSCYYMRYESRCASLDDFKKMRESCDALWDDANHTHECILLVSARWTLLPHLFGILHQDSYKNLTFTTCFFCWHVSLMQYYYFWGFNWKFVSQKIAKSYCIAHRPVFFIASEIHMPSLLTIKGIGKMILKIWSKN